MNYDHVYKVAVIVSATVVLRQTEGLQPIDVLCAPDKLSKSWLRQLFESLSGF